MSIVRLISMRPRALYLPPLHENDLQSASPSLLYPAVHPSHMRHQRRRPLRGPGLARTAAQEHQIICILQHAVPIAKSYPAVCGFLRSQNNPCECIVRVVRVAIFSFIFPIPISPSIPSQAYSHRYPSGSCAMGTVYLFCVSLEWAAILSFFPPTLLIRVHMMCV